MYFPFVKNFRTAIATMGLAIGCVFLSVSAQASSYEKMHKWVDQNGSTHYTLTPPPANAKKVGTIDTYNDTPNYTPPPATSNSSNSSNTTTAEQPRNVIPVVPPRESTDNPQ